MMCQVIECRVNQYFENHLCSCHQELKMMQVIKMTKTEMVLKTLAYWFFNHLLWVLTQESSTDMSNVSPSHSCCHLADNVTVSGKACFDNASIWLSLQQLWKPDRIATSKCSLPGFVTFTGLWHRVTCAYVTGS